HSNSCRDVAVLSAGGTTFGTSFERDSSLMWSRHCFVVEERGLNCCEQTSFVVEERGLNCCEQTSLLIHEMKIP
ncbi:hypothetical protein Tco_0283584, partial [Tanacetum coccineum]